MAEPVRELLDRLLSGARRGPMGDEYVGQRRSPDLPNRQDVQIMQGGGDAALQDYVNRFGFERLQNPQGPPRGYVPMPRERYPDLDPNNPIGPAAQEVPPGVTLRPQDIIRQQLEGEGSRSGDVAHPGGESVAPSAGEDANAPGPSDEQMLQRVQRGMGGSGGSIKGVDVDEDRAALEAGGYNEADVDAFVEHWGPDELPEDYQNRSAD
jgi:hypothetical protein